MKKIEFDELQQSRRYKYGYQAFILLAFLILFDSTLYSLGIIWMTHPTNTFIILLVGITYFLSRCILGDAVVGPKEIPKRMTAKMAGVILLTVVIAILVAGYAVRYLKISPSQDNNGSVMGLVCLGMWVVLGVVYLIKQIRGSKTEQ